MRVNTNFATNVALLALAVLLGACAMSDERLGALVSDSAQYELYSCDQLVVQEKTYADRLAQLDALMKKAGSDTGGSVVNAFAYKPEYISVRGSLDQVHRVESDKNCERPKGSAPARR